MHILSFTSCSGDFSCWNIWQRLGKNRGGNQAARVASFLVVLLPFTAGACNPCTIPAATIVSDVQ